MAMNFPESFGRIMGDAIRETLVSDFIFIQTEPFTAPTDEQREKAERFADKLIAEGKAMDYLEATAPKPCPECGNVP